MKRMLEKLFPPRIVYVPVESTTKAPEAKGDGGGLLNLTVDGIRQLKRELGAKRIYVSQSDYGDTRVSIAINFSGDMDAVNGVVNKIVTYFGLEDVQPKFRGYGSSISIDIKLPGLHIEVEN